METASNTVSAIIGQGIVPAALEMMDALTIRAVEESVQAGYPPDAGAVLLVEIDGLRETLDDQASAIEAICHECGAREVRVAEAAAERERLWAGRKGALGALGRLAPSYFIQDGVVPRTQLPAVLREVQAIGERYGVPIANVFHAGDGNLHPCILFDSRRAEQTERVVQAGAEILRACVDAGGSITGEHGIGLDKQDYMPWLFSEDDLEAMRKLKRAFNPDDLLNPGKLFPTGKSCGEVPKRLAALGGPLGVDAFI